MLHFNAAPSKSVHSVYSILFETLIEIYIPAAGDALFRLTIITVVLLFIQLPAISFVLGSAGIRHSPLYIISVRHFNKLLSTSLLAHNTAHNSKQPSTDATNGNHWSVVERKSLLESESLNRRLGMFGIRPYKSYSLLTPNRAKGRRRFADS